MKTPKEQTQEYMVSKGYSQCPRCDSVFLSSRRVDELGLELEIYCEDCGYVIGRKRNNHRAGNL